MTSPGATKVLVDAAPGTTWAYCLGVLGYALRRPWAPRPAIPRLTSRGAP